MLHSCLIIVMVILQRRYEDYLMRDDTDLIGGFYDVIDFVERRRRNALRLLTPYGLGIAPLRGRTGR